MKEPGPPCLALHGNLGSRHDWEALGRTGLRAVDLWAFSSLSAVELAHELATTLSFGHEKPLLAGYSLGGRLALETMALYPERWSGAVIVSAHSGLGDREDRLVRRVADEGWARDARSMAWVDFLEKWNRQAVFGGALPPSAQLDLEPRREAVALAFENWSLGRQDDLRPRLRSFRAPVLWITGGKDRKFTALAVEMGEVFPDFHHEILPGCGHRVLAERPEVVAQLIESRWGGGPFS